MKILHIITGLGDGGAEHTLYKICKYDKNNEHVVISFKSNGKYLYLLKKLGIEVYCLNLKIYSIYKFFYLIKLLRFIKPNIIQTWLVHADFIGGIAARISRFNNIIWNIRYSNLQVDKTKLATKLIIKMLSKLSYSIPKSIVIVSRKAKKIYEIEGYDKKKLKFIPNGYDLNILKYSNLQKKNFRNKLKFNKKFPIIGNVARYHPKKDHLNLLNALSHLSDKKIEFLCVLFGSDINKNNLQLTAEIKRLKLSKNVKLLGQNNNIAQVMNGIDLCIQSSSYGEGFPNVVAEAMACETPCVVTDVGDASLVVGKTGWVVPPNDSVKLAKAIEKAFSEIRTKKWSKRCHESRSRIKKNFDVNRMIKTYVSLWKKISFKN